MGRSQETFSKKENEKKRRAKHKEKAEKAAERKANSASGQGLDAMMAYVDEDGNITDTPPDVKLKREINPDEILLGARVEPVSTGERKGIVTHFNTEKGYGFIRDMRTQESIFVHATALDGITLKEGNKVTFMTEMGQKGLNAVGVTIV